MPKKKKKGKVNFLLANNPKNDNSCQCFTHQIPNADWIIIAHYPTMAQCQKVLAECSTFFMGMPITKAQTAMGQMSKKKKKMG